jgi:hypothetical protein
VPFLRFSRDKRGYEHTYLVHAANRRGKPSRPRILYWYRTPPGVRVGRKPFDEEVRRAIEAQHPGVAFDWASFSKAQIPAAEPEPWWERRRAERAAKQARRADDVGDEAAQAGEPDDVEPVTDADAPAAALSPASENEGEPQALHAADAQPGAGQSPDPSTARKRRRRGGRRRRGRSGVAGQADVAGPNPAAAGGAGQDLDAGPGDSGGSIQDPEDGPDGDDFDTPTGEE